MDKKLLFVIAPRDFRDEEFVEPRDVLRRAGVEVVVASLKRGICQGVAGTEVESNLTVKEAQPANFDGVVFIGGMGMAELVDNPSLKKLAQNFFQQEKLVAAICVAPLILAKAGILKGIPATCWQGSAQELQNCGADFSSKPVVVAGRVITASGPPVARTFGQKIGQFLEEN
jgi:protease I